SRSLTSRKPLFAGFFLQPQFTQSREKAGLVAENRTVVVVGMAPLPVRKNYHPRSLLAQYTRDPEPVLPGIFHAAIGNLQGMAKAGLQNCCRIGGFPGAILGGAACSHLALGEIENSCAPAALRQLEQRSPARLFDVVAMGRNGQNVQWRGPQHARVSRVGVERRAHSISPDSRVTFSLTINRCGAISRMCSKTSVACSSVSMKVRSSGNLPPASTSVEVLMRPCPVKPATVCNTVAPATSRSRRYFSISKCRGR